MDALYYKYGDFKIFFLLRIVDPETKSAYQDIDVDSAIENVLRTYGSLNELLGYPEEFMHVMIMLNAAYSEFQKGPEFNWRVYRKLILDAGHAVLDIKEV